MSNNVLHEDDLDRLRAEHPQWSMWWAESNSIWWAVPLWDGAPFQLVEAPTLTELAEHMRFIERRR